MTALASPSVSAREAPGHDPLRSRTRHPAKSGQAVRGHGGRFFLVSISPPCPHTRTAGRLRAGASPARRPRYGRPHVVLCQWRDRSMSNGGSVMRPSLSLPRSRPRRLSVEIGVLTVIAAFGGFAAPALAAQVTNVLVMNTSSNPVPVRWHRNVAQPSGHPAGSGTVSVGNFPATQSVNVTGGTITATPAGVDRASRAQGWLAVDLTEGDTFNLGDVRVSMSPPSRSTMALGEQDSGESTSSTAP